ncbi:RNA 2',3'-cyclic phosphodiesterase [Jannaschia sp. S6380]|uniref:RNA 2',3'-cyclic phosphodiesterase n=1 Tax=Jannaschia sp. S6380 TaxID=2926408 RepID=UPI001FF37B3C|nr:RNA 2',3'-cyclic phosphodiesterase [Jannaschia sp. S6380]MCK0168905.1 RNA 2',3'-cyclic phosphodiesterase [Jannaschia sp. S6380]
MRAFVGLPLPEAWIGPLIRAQGRIAGGRKVDADDLHLTLAFLDEQPEARLEALHQDLEARALPAGDLHPLTYAALGSGRPRAVVLDLATDPGLTALRDAVRSACRAAGIDLPRERFRPHVTLVRFSSTAPGDADRLPDTLRRLNPPDLGVARATGAVLWSSQLRPDGPIYEALASYPVRAA